MMAILRVSDIKRELTIFPTDYIDDLIVGLLNGNKPQRVKEILLVALEENSKMVKTE